MASRRVIIDFAPISPLQPALVSNLKYIHVIQAIPVGAPDISIVTSQIPVLEVVIFPQPAGKFDLTTVLIIVVMRHYWPGLVLMRGGRLHDSCQHASAQHDRKQHPCCETALGLCASRVHDQLLILTVRVQDRPSHMNPDLIQVFVFVTNMNAS